jgi:hypothetical protein
VGAGIATVVMVLVAGGVGYWASNALLPKFGLQAPRQQPPAKRRAFRLFLGVSLVIAAVVGWAFSTGHAGIGVAVLIVCFVLPEFVLIPLHIRRSRRAAERSRARRAGSSQHDG